MSKKQDDYYFDNFMKCAEYSSSIFIKGDTDRVSAGRDFKEDGRDS